VFFPKELKVEFRERGVVHAWCMGESLRD
jgi:hypothetical protein